MALREYEELLEKQQVMLKKLLQRKIIPPDVSSVEDLLDRMLSQSVVSPQLSSIAHLVKHLPDEKKGDKICDVSNVSSLSLLCEAASRVNKPS